MSDTKQMAPGIALSHGQRFALVQHFGDLTMEAVCSTARARELEAENQELRAELTRARHTLQQCEEEARLQAATVKAARNTIGELQDVIAGKAPLGRIPKPRTPRRKSVAK